MSKNAPKPAAAAPSHAVPTASETMERFEANLTKRLKDENQVGISPGLVLAIISALIPLLQKCLDTSPENLRRRPLGRMRLAAAIRRETGRSWGESRVLADMVLNEADEATDDEVAAFVSACGY